MIPETVLLCGVCMLYTTYIMQYCAIRRRENQQIIQARVFDPEIMFLHTTLPTPSQQVMFYKVDIELIAPLDSTEPNETDTCSICFEELKDVKYRRKTKCGHTFCSECIQEWLHKKMVCPLCMTNLTIP